VDEHWLRVTVVAFLIDTVQAASLYTSVVAVAVAAKHVLLR
jgi:hypothetical protein